MNPKTKSILFAGLVISISILNIISPIRVFSNKENRYLQGYPDISYKSIITGEFGRDFEKFITDQFVGRDSWISLKSISYLVMLKKDNGRVYFGQDDYLFDVDNEIDEVQLSKNIDNLNKFIDDINNFNKDVSISALLVPSKTEILKNRLPLYAPVIDEEGIVKSIKSSLHKDIKVLNLIDILKDKSKEYIFYKTDHHWTTKGAFYGYEFYLNEMGKAPLQETDFSVERVSNDFYGTNYRKSNFYLGNPDIIYSYSFKEDIQYEIVYNAMIKTDNLYDESFLNKTDKYSYFFGGDKALIEIKTSIKNNKTILVVKDSFANSFIPFLLNHYENIIVVDTRYLNMSISTFVKEKNVNEVLLIYSIQNFANEKSLTKLGI